MLGHLDVVGDWLRDGLLPATLLLLGAALLVRLARWTLGRYRSNVDEQIELAIAEEDVASETLKRSPAVGQVGPAGG